MRRAAVSLAMVTAMAVGGSAGCRSTSLPPMRILGAKTDAEHKPTFLGLPLKSGQLLLTESPDATSYVFVLIPKKFYPFTHVAIVSIEDGEPWVYDVTGEVKTFPLKKRLMDNVTGKMYRRRLYEYVAPNLYAEVYDPPEGADGEKVAAYARQKFKEGVEFDSNFDYREHQKLFCSELVSLAIEGAGGPRIEPEPSNPNPSVVEGMKWLGVPPGEALAAGRFVDPKRYVGALGQFPTRTSAWLYFEAKREIHRRFTVDQRMGFVLTLGGNGQVDVRPEITNFTIKASHLFDDMETPPEAGDPRLTEAVRKLAADMFGPFEAPAPEPKPSAFLFPSQASVRSAP